MTELKGVSGIVLVFLFCCLSAGMPCWAQEHRWSRWGGELGDFIIDDDWTVPDLASSNVTEVWSRELGQGNAALVGDESQVYAFYRMIEANGTVSDSETVTCFDSELGHQKWSASYGAPPLEGQNEYGGGIGPHATPLLFGGKLFTLGYTGILNCFDAETGKRLWAMDLVGEAGAEVVQFGFASSPIEVDNQLIVAASGSESGLLCLEPTNGKIRWQSSSAKPSYATPVEAVIDGVRQIVFQAGNTVRGIGIERGDELWRFRLRKQDLTNVPSPVICSETEIFISGQGVGGGQLLEIRQTAAGFEVKSVWRNSRLSFFHNNIVLKGNELYGGDSFLYGVDWKTGRRLWAERGYANANLIAVGPAYLVLTKNGYLHHLRLSREKTESISNRRLFQGNAWTVPTIIGDWVFARDREWIVGTKFGQVSEKGTSVRALMNSFESLAMENRFDELRLKLLEAIDREDSMITEGALIRLGKRRLLDENSEGVATYFELITSLFPTSTAARHEWARRLLVVGEREEAGKVYHEIVGLDPKDQVAESLRQQLEEPIIDGNITLSLEGYSDAQHVTVAGTFNGWSPSQTILLPRNGGWAVSLKLDPGEYLYKFVVDGDWITDPSNRQKRGDGNGNTNSVLTIE